MSGHSKWATIKHKKAAVDAKRGKMFTKVTKEITVAAKMGGGDPDGNPRLRKAVAEAKGIGMPKDNIERAIKKGTGELEGVSYEEISYEGYGPGGVAVLIESMTDNKNRTVAEIRHIFSKNNGNMGESGSVSWMFETKGYFVFEKGSVTEDRLMEAALDAGADDVREDDSNFEVISSSAAFEAVKAAFDEKGLKYSIAEITRLPQTYIELSGKEAEQMIKLIDALEDNDDVQKVYANFNLSAEAEAALG
jgi:YebC/PmpR family DNA-binding regulatory protein